MSVPTTQTRKDERLVVSPRRARYLLDVGNTRLYQLLAVRELDSFLDGRSRKITIESIHRYIERRLAENNPADSPTHKVGAPMRQT